MIYNSSRCRHITSKIYIHRRCQNMWCKTLIYNCCLLCKNYRETKFNQPSQISHTYCLPNKSPILILLIFFLLLKCLTKSFNLLMLLTIVACLGLSIWSRRSPWFGLSSGAPTLARPFQQKKPILVDWRKQVLESAQKAMQIQFEPYLC